MNKKYTTLAFVIIIFSVTIGVLINYVFLPNLAFLNSNQGALSALFSCLLCVLTFFYVWLTYTLVLENRKTRQLLSAPKILVYARPRTEWINFVDLTIENIGQGMALNVHFKLDPDFEFMQGCFLRATGFVKNGLDHFGPNEKIQIFLTNLVEDYQKKLENPFKIEVSYEDEEKRKYKDTFKIDFSVFDNIKQVGEPPIYRIAESIEEINKMLKSVEKDKKSSKN